MAYRRPTLALARRCFHGSASQKKVEVTRSGTLISGKFLAGFAHSPCERPVPQATSIKCQVTPIAKWHDRSLDWDGGCKGGKADGSGVLRAYEKKSGSPEIFYGRMRRGELSWGAMEVEGGYKGGRFVRGELQDDGERNTIIQAFEIANGAAKAYSQRLQKSGNTASAKFYRNKADKLDRQMD